MDWDALRSFNGFSRRMAYVLANAAEDSYLDHDDLESKWGCEVQHYSFGGTQFIAIKGDSLIIAFRGTEPNETEDIATDFDVRKRPLRLDRTLYVHSGFLSSYWLCAKDVIDTIKKENKPTFLCGHSLGGGISNVAFLDLELRGLDIRRSYTFGAPRTYGWRASRVARNKLGGRQFRIVNRNDIVPRIPSMLRFQHTGDLVYINRRDKIEMNPSCAYVTYDRMLGYRANMIRSHFMIHYKSGVRPLDSQLPT